MSDPVHADPARYRRTIRALHWLVVGLVILQFLSGGGMAQVFPERLSTDTATPAVAVAHALVGLSILMAMIWRLVTRWQSQVPPPPANEPRWVQRISRGTHYAFYIVLIAMPLVGATALLTGSQSAGAIHALTSWVLLALIFAHVAGASWHVVRRDGVIRRILTIR